MNKGDGAFDEKNNLVFANHYQRYHIFSAMRID